MLNYRKHLVVQPTERLSPGQVQDIHRASLELLDDPGIRCSGDRAASIFDSGGCTITRDNQGQKASGWRVRIPESVVSQALLSVPSQIILGARDPENALFLDGKNTGVYFGTGSETNVFLDSRLERFVSTGASKHSVMLPVYTEESGSIGRLCVSAHLAEQLSHVDFFIRNVNIQAAGNSCDNKDVNVFFAALLYTTKHVQSGLENINALEQVLRLAGIVAEAGPLEKCSADKRTGQGQNTRADIGKFSDPVFKGLSPVSFIACPVKSPLQMVADTSDKVIAIAEAGMPLVISSSPQGGSTAPIQEEGIVAQINAEILAGVILTQLVRPGTPVLYGAVPVRARLDNLHDFYGAPEFIHYNVDCVQMARHYEIPCYSTAGAGDARRPGMQSTIEKLPAYLSVAGSGAQYIHYAFGLLDRTNIFSPLQAVLDNAAVGLVKDILRPCVFTGDDVQDAVQEIRKVTGKSGFFARGVRRQLRRGVVSDAYELVGQGNADQVLENAQNKLNDLYQSPGKRLDQDTVDRIYRSVPGLADRREFDIFKQGGKE